MRLLLLSNLFPDASEPIRGLDNATLLETLAARHGLEARVLSPRPRLERWLGANQGQACLRALPHHLAFEPAYVPVRHLPKLGGIANAELMCRDLRAAFQGICEEFRPEAALAPWLFPDGCAAAALCSEAGLPLTLVAQGSDVHRYLDSPPRRRRIVAAATSARAVICRSGDLARRLADAGVPPERLEVIYNGVDTEIFRPRDRAECRAALGLGGEGPLLLFVGNLLPVKDPLFLLRAVSAWNTGRSAAGRPCARLRFIGDGPLRSDLVREIARLGAEPWADLLGRRPPEEVARWMGAADLLCLSSRNEGFPNVILEAMACDLPVVSTAVGGIGEKVGAEAPGRLVPLDDKATYVDALEEALAEAAAPRPSTAAACTWSEAADCYWETLNGPDRRDATS